MPPRVSARLGLKKIEATKPLKETKPAKANRGLSKGPTIEKTLIEHIVRKNTEQKITRVFYSDKKKFLSDSAIVDLSKSLKASLNKNEKFMIRAMTEYGMRTLKGLNEDDIKFQSAEEYLEGTSNPEAKEYRQIFYIDVYTVKNKV